MILHADWATIERALGCALPDRFLMALRAFDNTRSVTPFIVESHGRTFGLFLHVEKGNVAAADLPPHIEPVFYQPYFNFDPDERPPLVHPTLEDALQAIGDGDRNLTIDGSLPIGLTRRLAARFTLFSETPDAAPVTVRRLSRADVIRRHARDRPRGAECAQPLLKRSRYRDAILPFLAPMADNRFARLDKQLAECGASALIASSVINVQELAGVPMRGAYRPLAAIYKPGEDILLFDRDRSGHGHAYPSLREAFDAEVPRTLLAVEQDDLQTRLVLATGLDERETIGADDLLRRWRDEGTLPDLAFYIVTTRASRHAIEAALGFAERGLAAGDPVDEMDAYAVYLRALQDFFSEHAPGFEIARTLTNFHAGARTIFPSNAAPFPLSKNAGTLKIDAGCLMMSQDGMMLGCSDIARTLAFDDPTRELAEVFEQGVRDVLIPGCRDGQAGADLHAAGVRFIASSDRLHANPLYRDIAQTPQTYARDVGHLLGRNNLAHLKFTSDETGHLREGMIACCEYQWPLDGHAVAYEDTCLVTASTGINLTVD